MKIINIYQEQIYWSPIYTVFMNLHPPRMWLPPDPPEQADPFDSGERDALEEQASAQREAQRVAKLAVLSTGPALHDIGKAADCPCSCHPSPASPDLHEGGARCPCQLTRAELDELWDRLLEPDDATEALSAEEDRARAELARVAAELGVDAAVECWAFPFVVAGTCDGRSFYLRERHGHWRVEVAADPGCADLWGTRGAVGIEVAAGQETDLCDADGRPSPAVALRVAVSSMRLSTLRDRCSHELPSGDSHRFCRRCGTPFDESEQWRWPAPPAA